MSIVNLLSDTFINVNNTAAVDTPYTANPYTHRRISPTSKFAYKLYRTGKRQAF